MSDEPIETWRYHLTGYLNDHKAKKAIRTLLEMDCADPSAVWEILISSPGGDMEAGTAIFSELYSYSIAGGGSHVVTTKVRGEAASAASLVFQAGDVRLMGELDALVLHQPSLTLVGAAPLYAVRDALARCESWFERFADVYLYRSDMSREDFFDSVQSDWTLFGSEAIEYGFCDGLG